MIQGHTLIDIFENRSVGNGIIFIEGSDNKIFISYQDLFIEASRALYVLQEKGLKLGDELVIQSTSNKNFIVLFWACILGGIIPIPFSLCSSLKTVQYSQYS